LNILLFKNEEKQDLEAEPYYEKRERRSHVNEKKSSGAGAVTFRPLRSPGHICRMASLCGGLQFYQAGI